jgi:hypothetical protein
MLDRHLWLHIALLGAALAALASCAPDRDLGTMPQQHPSSTIPEPGIVLDLVPAGQTLPFTPLAGSAACTAGGNAQQIVLPAGYVATVLATEGAGFPDLPDMNTVNETGPQPGRFLYRTHEVGSNGAVSRTDLATGVTSILAQRADWERFDGLAWTPWGTLIAAEEATVSAFKDPLLPAAVGGHVYEIDPASGTFSLREAVGSRSHEGLRFDKEGNLYGISETGPGYIFKFVPDRRNELSAGQLYALRIVVDQGDRTGWAEWVALDRTAVTTNSLAEAAAKGATGWSRPEDIEIGTSSGDDRRGNSTLYVAVTGEDKVLAIDLSPPGGPHGLVLVSNYIKDGVNAPADFDFPDNLALDRAGNLYITEDPGGSAGAGKIQGDDVWFAPFNPAGATQSLPVQRFFSITDCDAEPTGIYLSLSGKSLFVNLQHRGGADPRDQSYAVQRLSDVQLAPPQ